MPHSSTPLDVTKLCTSHPIRLLTLIKHSKTKDTLTSCLSVSLSSKHRSLIVSTEEQQILAGPSSQQQQQQQATDHYYSSNDTTTKFNCSELFQEGQWLHIVLVWSRAVLKNSQCTLFVNSKLIGSHKLHYINSINMQTNPVPLSSISIHACIGTLPMLRVQSPVVWRQANCYLFEDILSPAHVNALYQLGPNYLGSFQSPSDIDLSTNANLPNVGTNSTTSTSYSTSLPSSTSASSTALLASHISEEKIIFGLHAQKCFEMTLAKFRKGKV